MKKKLLSAVLTLLFIVSLFPSNIFVSAAGDECFDLSPGSSCTEKIKVSFSIPEGIQNIIGLQFIMSPPVGYTVTSVTPLINSAWVFDYNTIDTNRYLIYHNSNSLIFEDVETAEDGKYALFEFTLKSNKGSDVSGSHNFRFKVEEIITKGIVTYSPNNTFHKTVNLSHVGYTSKVTAPTCTTNGYTTHTCKCGYSYTDAVVEALGHSYSSVTTAPTCTDNGFTTHTCSTCGDSYVDCETQALGHSYGVVVTAPTCTTDGHTTYTCSKCKDSYVTDETPANGHNYIAKVTEHTCTQDGFTTYTCTDCGDSYIEDGAFAEGHGYQEVVTAPTCTEEGYTTYTCLKCGYSYKTKKVSAKGHNYIGSVTKDPTCIQDGVKTFTCTSCKDSKTVAIAATGHTYSTDITYPTCIEAGYTTYTCHCGDAYIDDEVPANGHSYRKNVVTPTCTQDGYTTYFCDCGDSYIDDLLPAVGHTYDKGITTKSPTCTKSGIKTFTCRNCDDYYTEKISPKGHVSKTLKSRDATCTKTGLTQGSKCSVCDKILTAQKTIAKKAHSYKTTTTRATLKKNGKTVKKCTVCGKISNTTTIYAAKTVKLSKTSFTYTRKYIKPSIVIKNSKGKTISSKYYTVSGTKSSKNIGKFKITIKFKGNYSGTKTLYYTINPKAVSNLKLTAGKKQIKISYKKDSSVSGYEIKYSTNKSFKKAKTLKVSSTKKTITKLTTKKTYYVKVRAFKKVSGKTYYGAYCKTKTVKVK